MKRVAIVMGSDSDLKATQGAMDALNPLQVPCAVHVISAHRTPEAAALAKSARVEGFGSNTGAVRHRSASGRSRNGFGLMQRMLSLVLALMLCFVSTALGEMIEPSCGGCYDEFSIEMASQAEIGALVEYIMAHSNQMFMDDIKSKINGALFVGATMGTVVINDVSKYEDPYQTLKIIVKAPPLIKENDEVILIMGIMDIYGCNVYTVFESHVQEDKMEYEIPAELCQYINGTKNTQFIFFRI